MPYYHQYMTGINSSLRVWGNLCSKRKCIEVFLLHIRLFISMHILHISYVYKYLGLLFARNRSFLLCYFPPNKMISTSIVCCQYFYLCPTSLCSLKNYGNSKRFTFTMISAYSLARLEFIPLTKHSFCLTNIPLNVEIIFTNPYNWII